MFPPALHRFSKQLIVRVSPQHRNENEFHIHMWNTSSETHRDGELDDRSIKSSSEGLVNSKLASKASTVSGQFHRKRLSYRGNSSLSPV
jgi:hypothetical protein